MKNIKDFLLDNGYNLAQFYNEFKTHSSYNSFTKMINEDNAATRLAAALISIMESIKVYPIDVVKVEPYLLFQFREQYQKTVKILRGQYSDLRPHEISDIQLRQFKTGKAQLFFWVRDDCYELELQPSNWCFIDEVETGEQ